MNFAELVPHAPYLTSFLENSVLQSFCSKNCEHWYIEEECAVITQFTDKTWWITASTLEDFRRRFGPFDTKDAAFAALALLRTS